MTQKKFGEELGKILAPHLLSDMIDQEDLFEMQEAICGLICKAANSRKTGLETIAFGFIDMNPRCFKTE